MESKERKKHKFGSIELKYNIYGSQSVRDINKIQSSLSSNKNNYEKSQFKKRNDKLEFYENYSSVNGINEVKNRYKVQMKKIKEMEQQTLDIVN